jgi:hypothetical protein
VRLITAFLDTFHYVIDLFLRRVSAHVDDHSENASCVFAAKSLISTKKPASPIRGAGSVETLCGFFGPRYSGDHPQSRLYFAAPPPEEAARKGEPIISNQIHLRRETLKPRPSI